MELQDPPILVDFEGGEMHYKRVVGMKNDKVETQSVTDKAGYEALILSPDGKLLAHDQWVDKNDKERTDRLSDWRNRIEDVRSGKSDSGNSGGGTGPSNPFGGGRGG